MKLGPPTLGNAYEDNPADMLPPTLDEAVKLARGSKFMKDVLGEDRWEIFLTMCEREVEFVRDQVTPVETERYLHNL